MRQSDPLFLQIAEHSPDVIYRYRVTPPRGFEYVSPTATAITGYTPEEHYADPDLGFKLIHPDDRARLEAVDRGETAPGAPLAFRWIRKDGAIVWTEQRNVPIYDSAGKLVAIEGIARDITGRMQAEVALRESQERLRTVLNHAPITIFALDSQGVFNLSEGKGLEQVGLKPGENVGVSALDLYASLSVARPGGETISGLEVIRRVRPAKH